MHTKTNPHTVILYDLAAVPGDDCSFSPFVWRIRLALNYKRIPYKTCWVELPDIAEVGRSIGAEPTAFQKDGPMHYTVPMLVDTNHLMPDGKPITLSDSPRIIRYLEETYPEPKLIPDNTVALHESWTDFIRTNLCNLNLLKLIMPEYPKIMTKRASEYLIRTREKRFGVPLSQLCVDREAAWKVVREGLDKIATALAANTDSSGNGDDDHGKCLTVIPGTVCYADFVLVSVLLWIQATVKEEEAAALKTWNGGKWANILAFHRDLLQVC